MWFIGKIRESMESIPLELSRYMEKSEEDSKASLTHNLPNNILTPDKIPEFCLPPRLCKRNLLQEVETMASLQHSQTPKSSTSSSNATRKEDMKKKHGEASAALQRKKPLPFSAEAYGLVGMYERPNTRRKESLFHHSKCPAYMLDRSVPPKLSEEKYQQKKTSSGFLPLFLCKSLSETGSTESETHSSSDSSPLSSPYSAKSSLYRGRLKGATSCPSLIDNREDRGRWKRKMGFLSLTTSPSSPPKLEGGFLASAPSVPFPLHDQREHLLSLNGRGKVHLLAELTTSSPSNNSYFSTVRIRVMSVEGIYNQTDRRALNCALSLCLTPGMLQQQESTSIRNCRSPVFNEDFFFSKLSREDLVELQLRLKVMDKPAAAAQRRGVVIGLITTPLSQLLDLKHG
ncbi:C2 calcium-dependent domain-containing protein 4C [Labrus bergylta]|uniref:C2 calcium-dependent domain-containing protein 4C-like n=1 Tax=Labrus bergylta TaxID=56723 RepID=A0A3Q3LHG1_9LABR|nr:C2 calcium-dependent domain-containing protein 4C-like [Labrus bergylta]